MGTRGRRSTDELMVVKGPHGAMVKRPDPPRDLGAAESIEWCAIVASMPPGYFARIHYPMLVELCSYVVECRFIRQALTACRKKKKFDRREHARLFAMHLKGSAMIMRLQRAMRLTQSTVMDRTATRKLRPVQTNGAESPWNRVSA